MPFWIVIIILALLFILIFIIIWLINFLKNKPNKNKVIQKIKNPKSEIIKNNYEKIRKHNLELQKKNKPVFGLYNNFFGTKQSISYRKLFYVEEKKDSCELCRKFENTVLSMEKYDSKYVTIYEAMNEGFNHLGCNCSTIDYLPNNTIIPDNRFSDFIKNTNFSLKKEQFKFEKKIRDLKYDIDNKHNFIDNTDALKKFSILEKEYTTFLNKHKLIRNLKREDYKSDDSILFS